MKQLFILINSFLLLSSLIPKNSYSIEVEIMACESKKKYSDWVYLLKSGRKIDSAQTYQYKDYFISQSWIRNTRFKFKGLSPGDYHIKYTPKYNFDSLASVQIVNSNKRIEICFDEIPLSAYDKTTAIDKLTQGDTLFINGYIAAAGEFGGFDEGIWVWKDEDQLKGQIFSLANSYALNLENDLEEFYKENIKKAKPLSKEFYITKGQLHDIKRFLIETKSYKKEKGFSNAPEFITVYSKKESYKIIKHDFTWKPYLNLKERITTANKVYK